MEKMKNNAGRTRISTRQLVSASMLLLPALAAGTLFLALSCDLFTSEDPFPSRYYTANFIEAYGFDLQALTDPPPDPADPPVIARWDASYRYSDWDGEEYITLLGTGFTAADFTPPPEGLDPDSPVFRLRVVNLLPDNHFESGIPAGWGGTGVWAIESIAPVNGSGSLALTVTAGNFVEYQTTAALSAGVTYRWFIDFLRGTGTPVESVLGTITNDGWVSTTYTASGANFSLRFEPPTDQEFAAVLDDLQLVKEGGMSVRLRLRAADTQPRLESGVYSFSLWVHDDPAADSAGETGPYPLESFLLNMVRPEPANPAIKLASVEASYSPQPGWQRLAATLKSHALMFPPGDIPVIDLVIDLSTSRSGTVLIAAPVLRFHPNGL